jgi:hypothetical protein
MLTGRVLSNSGNPLAGATVYFVDGPVALPDIAQVTGIDGRFSLAVPVSGFYRIGVSASGHADHTEDVEVGGDAPPSIDIRMRALEQGG